MMEMAINLVEEYLGIIIIITGILILQGVCQDGGTGKAAKALPQIITCKWEDMFPLKETTYRVVIIITITRTPINRICNIWGLDVITNTATRCQPT